MTKPRVTNADRLSNIIEVVELGRRSGLLTVERGSNQNTEQGDVYFTQGRATYAAVEGLRGRDALTVLAGWGQCRFAFDPDAAAPAPNIQQAYPQQQTRPTTNPNQGQAPSQPRSAPSGFDWGAASNRPIPDPLAPMGPPTAPHRNSQPGGASWPTSRPASMPSVPSTGQLSWPAGLSQPGSNPSATSGSLERRPRRAPDVRDLISVVNNYNLSRNHRTILLLADGEHTLLDLARLSSKTIDEVAMLVSDLERRGLMY